VTKVKVFRSICIAWLCMLGCVSTQTYATIIQTAQGFSVTGTEVNFKSQLTITGNILTIELFNRLFVVRQQFRKLLNAEFD